MAIKEYADTINYTMGIDADILYLYGGVIQTGNGYAINISNAQANDKDNTIYGTDGSNVPGYGANGIHAGAGNDKVFGYGGNDQLYGEDGNDRLDGGAGGDWILGGTGNDTIIAGNGDSTEWVYYTPYAGSGVWVSPGIPSMKQQATFDYIDGGDGNDLIYSDGYDDIHGGAGDDRIILPSGTPVFVTAYGDEGNDRFIVNGYSSAAIYGGDGIDTIVARGNFDMYRTADDVERLVVRSTEGVNIVGRYGDDNITGGVGNDTIIGNGGKDRLAGNDGDDVLQVNGLGRTNLIGGAGADTFYFGNFMSGNLAQGADDAIVIQDFEDGVDKIRLGYDIPDTNSFFVLQGITVGTVVTKIANNGESFGVLYKKAKLVHDTAGGMSLAYFEFNNNTYLIKDNSMYDSVQELSIRIAGVHDFSMSDFIIESF